MLNIFGMILKWFGEMFGMILGCIWNDLGMLLEWFWHDLGMIVGRVRDDFGMVMIWFFYDFGMIFKLVRPPCFITVSYSKDCLPKGLPTRPTRSVPTADPYRPVLNIFQKNRECDFFEKLCVGKLADRRPTRRTDPSRTVPFFFNFFYWLFIWF